MDWNFELYTKSIAMPTIKTLISSAILVNLYKQIICFKNYCIAHNYFER
jgi:hypothetical protein